MTATTEKRRCSFCLGKGCCACETFVAMLYRDCKLTSGNAANGKPVVEIWYKGLKISQSSTFNRARKKVDEIWRESSRAVEAKTKQR